MSNSGRTSNQKGRSFNQKPNVLLYIDNSNIFETAKKYSGQTKGYINGIQDVACRIDVGKLLTKAVGNRTLLFGKLYGSVPPALDTVWEAIRKKKIKVKTFERSKWTLKEKEIDTSLAVEATRDIILEKPNAGDDRTVILFSGDRDLIPVVNLAMDQGYRVEIWSFKSSMNALVKKLSQANPAKIHINSIDDIFSEITFTKYILGKGRIPPERSLVASVSVPPDNDRNEYLIDFVISACNNFHLPIMGKYLKDYRYIVLTPCIKEVYEKKQGPGGSPDDRPPEIKQNFSFEKDVKPYIFVLREHFDDTCQQIQTWFEFCASQRPKESDAVVVSSRYDMLSVSHQEDDDDEPEDQDYADFFDSHPEEVSDGEDNDIDPEAEDMEDSNEFQSVVAKERRKKPKSRDLCIYKFWCVAGPHCRYTHTPQEEEYFKQQPDPKRRQKYKIIPCFYEFCDFTPKSYLCSFAHRVEESRCLACKQKGNGKHWMHECPSAQDAYKKRMKKLIRK